MATLLFEVGTEELPSWFVSRANAQLPDLLAGKLHAAHLAFEDITPYATPRRLALLVHGLAPESSLRTEKKRGPAKEVAFDEAGNPTKAALGFANANDVAADVLEVEHTSKGDYIFASVQRGGREAEDIVPKILSQLLDDLPALRKMRWGTGDIMFVRPLAWLVALLDDQVLEVTLGDLHASNVTYGHRFLAPQAITLAQADDYPRALEEAYVIPSLAARRATTWQVALDASRNRDLTPTHNHKLLEDIANLVEYPVAIVGTFDPRYLDLPSDVLETVIMHQQRFLPLHDDSGKLAAQFVAIANNHVADESIIRRGYERVLTGKLEDATFFWQADRRKTLAQHAWGLSGISFYKDLGSMAEKVARVEVSAENLAEALELPDTQRDILRQALPVFRADLNTQMVAEMPELEGTMACVYAKAEGYPEAVAEALEHGVRPQTPGAPLPGSSASAVLAVTDRSDRLVGLFALDKRPSGSADPLRLRRDAIALARILNAQGWTLTPKQLLNIAAHAYDTNNLTIDPAALHDLDDFVWQRIMALLREESIDSDIVRAACYDRPAVIIAARRSHLLTSLRQQDAFQDLLALYKRAANLAKDTDDTTVNPKRFKSDHEAPLLAALEHAQSSLHDLLTTVRRVLVPWDLGRSPARTLPDLNENVAGILALKEPLDAFLDNVLVKVDDDRLRLNRLALLRNVQNTLRVLGNLDDIASKDRHENTAD
jgi:glycyl-tRNA synthetase beta chain